MKIVVGPILLALAGIMLLRTPDTDPAEMRARYGAAPSQFLALPQGPVVHLRDEGPRDGPVLVLLHGSNADLATWDPWVAALRDRYRIIRIDQIGHGLTGADPTGRYDYAAMAMRLGQVMDRLGIARFALAGNSMGGGVALRFALDQPQRVAALVLVDAAGAPVARNGGGNIGFKLAAMPGVSQIMQQVTPRWLIERSLRQTVSNQAIVTQAMVDRYWQLLRYPGNRAATAWRFSQPRVPFAPDQLARLGMPVLVLWGSEDRLIPLSAGQYLARTIPGAKLIVYPGIGHLPHEEAASQTARDLADWLGQQDVGGAGR